MCIYILRLGLFNDCLLTTKVIQCQMRGENGHGLYVLI
jgi:hypothetical protein